MMKRIECSICEKTFGTKQRLNSHIAEIHDVKNPQISKLNDQSFASKQSLNTHLTSVYVTVDITPRKHLNFQNKKTKKMFEM
jgi:hypothetical protein